jgi:hypothetical protein
MIGFGFLGRAFPFLLFISLMVMCAQYVALDISGHDPKEIAKTLQDENPEARNNPSSHASMPESTTSGGVHYIQLFNDTWVCTTHILKPGEDLMDLSDIYNRSARLLRIANDLKHGRSIRPGDVLLIPLNPL